MDLKSASPTYLPLPLSAIDQISSIGKELIPDVPEINPFDAQAPSRNLPKIPLDSGGPSNDEEDDVLEESDTSHS